MENQSDNNMLFDEFKQVLVTALTDQTFSSANSLMQNSSFQTEVLNRVNALQPSQMNISLDTDDIIASNRYLSINASTRQITFPTDQYSVLLGSDTLNTPNHIWSRAPNGAPTPADGIRYLVTDTVNGVICVGGDFKAHRVIPSNNTVLTGGYSDATAAISFTISSVEYVAIAMSTHHCVRIFNYLTGAPVATIGIVNIPGADSEHLDNPISLAFDSTTNYLYILSQKGMPSGATANGGFISRFVLTIPTIPTFIDFFSMYALTGSVLNGEIDNANSIFLDGTNLWIGNGTLIEVGALNTTTKHCTLFFSANAFTNGICTPFFGYGQPTTTLSSVGDVSIRTKVINLTTYKYLYITDAANGVLVVDLQVNQLRYFFNFHQPNAVGYIPFQTLPTKVSLPAVLPDTVTLNGVPTDVFLVTDPQNNRLVMVDEFDADGRTAQCLYTTQNLQVPIRLTGYALASNIPANAIRVDYKTSQTDNWHTLNTVTNTPPSTYYQFRLTIQVPIGYVSLGWNIKRLLIMAQQA